MCKIRVVGGLPFVRAELGYRGHRIELEHVLLDTGSGGSVFSADQLLDVDLHFERGDPVRRIRGVGGTEFVFTKQVEALTLGSFQVKGFRIEVGALEYGFTIDGILGMDYLLRAGAVLDLDRRRISCRGQRSSEHTVLDG
ncbi:MAG: hypothetical protein GY719_05305 [bacterium]|nr:hypothetical protein [bacterium]